jgi:hypothetical protein
MARYLIAAALLVCAKSQASQCSAPVAQCLRPYILKSYTPNDPQSASVGACCTACLAYGAACLGAQLYSLKGSAAYCQLMSTQNLKPPVPDRENCTSTTTGATPPPERFNRTSYSGVWLQHGNAFDLNNISYLVGSDFPVQWADVEISDGVWDFSSVDAYLVQAAGVGLYTETALEVGDAAPQWIYARKGGNVSVPLVIVDSSQGKGKINFPYYLDATYTR